MIKQTIFPLILVAASLMQNAHAFYYDPGQDLTYARTDEITGNTWRNATEQDIANLFDLQYLYQSTDGVYRQQYVDIVLGLGGGVSNDFSQGTLIGCDPTFGPCQQQAQTCEAFSEAFPIFSGCASLIYDGAGAATLDGVYIFSDVISPGGKQELWIDYRYDDISDSWRLEILGPAAELGDYCGADGGPSCDIPGLVISTVPIPAAIWLFGSALAGLGWMRRKQTV